LAKQTKTPAQESAGGQNRETAYYRTMTAAVQMQNKPESDALSPEEQSRSFPPLPAEPVVSIVIPVKNEEHFMDTCIRNLKKLDYPTDKFEVIFADGRSTDRTAEIARASGYRVIDNPGLKISAGRNEGFAASKGEIVVFTDADCQHDPQWLRKAVGHFRTRLDIGGLSGPTPVPDDQNAFGKAVGIVFDLAGLTGGTVHVSRHNEAGLVDDLPGCNAFYRREALQAIMPTNTSLFSNEDVEMNACLRRRGIKLLMTPDVLVHHYKRTSAKKFWRQMHVFAIGRLQLGKTDSTFLKPVHFAMGIGLPLLAVAVLLAGFVAPVVWVAALAAAAVGAFVTFVCFSLKYSPAMAINVVVALAVFATAWPSGFLRELLFPVRSASCSKGGQSC
jgi:cellulose synthase/poly-beta-1,6-N-acetylglucosamine synthase-like glycosyltransferase